MSQNCDLNFNEVFMSNYILSNVICKGFSLHTEKAQQVWTLLLNALVFSFEEIFGEMFIINSIPATMQAENLCEFYGDHFYRLKDRIPSYTDENNLKRFITTDALCHLATLAKKHSLLFSTYTVVRPRNFAVKSLLREEFIRYFQIVISVPEQSINDVLAKLEKTLNEFFRRIGLATVIVDRYSDSYYNKKSCFHSVWLNGNIESVLQCGILKKQIGNKVVIDIGGAQRLLASFIFANIDSYGLFMPHYLRTIDVIICIRRATHFYRGLIANLKQCGIRVFVCDKLGDISLKKIKTTAIEESAIALIIQREKEGKEFYEIFNRDLTKSYILIESEILQWVVNKYNKVEERLYNVQNERISSHICGDDLFVRNFDKNYPLIRNGIFGES